MTDPDPTLSLLRQPSRDALRDASERLCLAPGSVLYRSGDAATRWFVVLGGSFRVTRAERSGRAITLYRVGAGQSCALTTACLLAGMPYEAEAVAETEVEALATPAPAFGLLCEDGDFRRFVFRTDARRLAALYGLIGELAFEGVGAELGRRLLARAGPDGLVAARHEGLAEELGVSRETISRRLVAFERLGLVSLGSGRIRIASRAGLEAATAWQDDGMP